MKKILALILCLVQLLACFALSGCSRTPAEEVVEEVVVEATVTPTPEVQTEPAFNVIYIPLDNRPINDEQVRMLAKSLRINLMMPDVGVYATKLNGAVNDAGLQYGDRAAILEWLMENEGNCETMIIYLDQLLSGGLMYSRCMEDMEPVTLSDGSVYTEYEIIDYLAQLAEDHTIYVIDSQLRLATSSDYLDFSPEENIISRYYGMIPRPVLDPETATIEDVIAGYTLNEQGGEAIYNDLLSPEQVEFYMAGGEDSLLNRFLSIRERKLRLNAYAVEKLFHLENVEFFFGVDDSAVGNNVQSGEYTYLNALAGGQLEKLSAIDCLGELALGCVFRDYCGGEPVTVNVRFFGSEESELNYAGHTLPEAIEQVIRYCGGQWVEADGEVDILVACEGANAEENTANALALAKAMAANEEAGMPTIYVDFASAVNRDILELADITMLLSAGLHANGSGASAIMGISQGLARYRALQMEGYLDEACHKAFLEDMVFMFSKGYYWGSSYKSDMGNYITELGLSTANMTNATDKQVKKINGALTEKILESSEPILENVKDGGIIVSLQPYEERVVESVTISNCSYPWARVFEYTAEFEAVLK